MKLFSRQAIAVCSTWGYALALFAILIATLSAQGQVFALVNKGSSDKDTSTVSNYKYAVASNVFKGLISARGDKSSQVPTFVMHQQARYGTWLDLEKVQVGLEEAAYDVCASFGNDSLHAIAALLSHQLTHYYDQHNLSQSFSKEASNLETGLQQEIRADYLGGLLAHFSGYNTAGIMPQLLNKLYGKYKLSKSISGYPSLKDRITAADTVMANMNAFMVRYETCNILSIIAEYEAASAYYGKILQDFQSVEIFNNGGVIAMMAALDYISPKDLPYILPTEMAPSSRLAETRVIKADTLETGRALLLTALQRFEAALALDEGYLNGYLNKGTVLALLHEFDAATVCILEGKKRCSTQRMSTDFLVMEGIIEAMRGKNSIAVQHLNTAKTIGSYLAVQNLNIVRNIRAPALALTEQIPAAGEEQIEWYPLAEFYAKPMVEEEIPVTKGVFCGIQQKAVSRLYLHEADHGNQRIVIQETSALYRGSSQSNIKLGSTGDIVQESYGVPKRNIVVAGRRVWVYPEMRLYFRFKDPGVVAGWGVYLKGGN